MAKSNTGRDQIRQALQANLARKEPNRDIAAVIRAALRTVPRYWVSVSDRPAQRSAQAMFVADVERAIFDAIAKAEGR